MATPPKGEPTAAQLDTQHKFSLVVNFISTMIELLQQTFAKFANGMSESNAAFSYNFSNAITGTSPDYSLDFSKALVSRGELHNASGVAATITNKSGSFYMDG